MTPELERALVALLFVRPVAWNTLGRSLKPAAMPSKDGANAVRLATIAAGNSGNAPGGVLFAYQAAEVLVADGGAKPGAFDGALRLIEEGLEDFDCGLDPTAVLRAASDTVRRYEVDQAAGGLIDKWAKQLDPSKSVDDYLKAKMIGENEDRGTQVLTVQDRLRVVSNAAKVLTRPTGVLELDVGLGGGLAVGNVGLIAGGPGDGKSSMLSQICAFAAGGLRLTSAIASCELRERQNVLKFESALWGVPIDAIKQNPQIIVDRYARRGHEVAPFYFRHWELSRGKPSVSAVFDWVDETESKTGRKIEVLGIDHFDRFGPSTAHSSRKSAGTAGADYVSGELVYDEIAMHAYDRQMAIWVPSHTVRKKSGPLWGPGDMAHSQHKEKRADAVFSLTAGGKPGARTVTAWLFKNREGEANVIVGPKPVGFAFGCAFLIPILAEQDDEYEGLL